MLYLFLMLLVGFREPDGLQRYQEAIEATTSDPEEQLLLGTTGRTENYFHLTSQTPPFGLTWETSQRRRRCAEAQRRHRQLVRRHIADPEPVCEPEFTVETGAAFALRSLWALRRTCLREVRRTELTIKDRWAMALGRYHHGTVGPNHGCWADDLALRQIAWMNTPVPTSLPRYARQRRRTRLAVSE